MVMKWWSLLFGDTPPPMCYWCSLKLIIVVSSAFPEDLWSIWSCCFHCAGTISRVASPYKRCAIIIAEAYRIYVYAVAYIVGNGKIPCFSHIIHVSASALRVHTSQNYLALLAIRHFASLAKGFRGKCTASMWQLPWDSNFDLLNSI